MKPPLIADTGGLLRALTRGPDGKPAWPAFAEALTAASVVFVPTLILAEVDYFLSKERSAMRKLVAEVLDPATTYQLVPLLPQDLARALELDAKFHDLELGLVDCTVAATAERLRIYRILTIDHSDFLPLRVGPNLRQALTLVP